MLITNNSLAIPAAVLVPVIARPNKLNLLLMQRSPHVLHHKSEICFPGGKKSSTDLNLTATALRETFEETGIKDSSIQVIANLPTCYTDTGYCITPIVGIINEPVDYIACPQEVTTLFEVPLPYLLERATSNKPIIYQEHKIWGATAKIINYFKTFWLEYAPKLNPISCFAEDDL